MSSVASVQNQWDTRPDKGSFYLRWTDDLTDSATFQRQFREFVSNEQQGLDTIYFIRLRRCPLKGMGAALQSLMEQLPKLKHLKLSFCEMSADDFRRARTKIMSGSLKTAVLNILNPSQELLNEFADFVSTQTDLDFLCLYASADSLEVTKKLLRALKSHRNLGRLKLCNTERNKDLVIDAGFVEALCQVLRHCTILSVVALELGKYHLEEEWADPLLAAVSEHEYIRTFSFNKKTDMFWDVLRTTAETQLRNVLRSGYDKEYTMEITKLVFIGDGAVGKSSTMRTILGEAFVAFHDSTVVLDVNSFATLNQRDLSFTKVDGNDYVRFQYNFLLGTLLHAQNEPASKLKLQPSAFSFQFEQDAVQEVVQDDYFQEFLKTGKNPHIDNDHLMQVFDFGGQEVFYSLHHLLLTNAGIHVLVFNMEETDINNMDRVRFWMESALLNAPNSMVIIVGTHYESVRDQSASSGTKLEEVVKSVNQKLIGTLSACSGRLQIIRNGRLSFFPLANSEGPGSAEAKSIITAIVSAMTGAAGFNKEVLNMDISVAEHMFMGNLLQNVKHMRREELFRKAQEAGFTLSETEVMLAKYTRVGLVLYFPDVVPEGEDSDNIVVLSPKWLTSALAKIIFDKLLHNLARHPPIELREDNETYLRTGVISKALLDFFWEAYADQKQFLLACSIKMLVLVRFSYGGKDEYLVPSMLPQNPIDNVGAPLNIPTEFHCAIYFKKYMPLGFFPRIVSVFTEIAQCSESSTKPLLSGSFCRIILDANFVICLDVNQRNNLVSISLETQETGLSKLLNLTEEVIEKVKNSVHEINLELVGLAFATKLPEETRQPAVGIADLKNPRNRRSFPDYMSHAVVDAYRFSSFEVPQTERPEEHFDLFLSHAWGHHGETHREVVKIEKLLTEHGLSCWIDERYMRGNIDFDMLHGLKSSSACVLFLTDSFFTRLENQNNNLTKEFFMIRDSKKRGKPVFLIALDAHLTDAENWPPFSILTFNFSEEEVFDFSSEAAIELNIEEFKDAVHGRRNLDTSKLLLPENEGSWCAAS